MNRELKIATAGSRFETLWKNDLTTWEDLKNHFRDPHIGHDTVAQYHSMKKSKKDDCKDVGGFVGGHLRNGRRRKGHAYDRDLITLDLDTPSTDLLDTLPNLLPCEWALYTTHSHTPDNPRYRLVLPLTRGVTEDEYGAISRRIAADVGIDAFDDTTYEPHRLMYWSSRPLDGEFIFKENTGEWVNPDAQLARYEDWRDMATWPTSSRQAKALQAKADAQANPMDKPGLVGAFCRTYSITEAIETFLTDIYVPTSTEGRYTYALGESTGGVVTYDNKFSYSHHGTDPASMQLCNAFDLVRIHKWHTWDEEQLEKKPKTPTSSLPSYKAMREFARTDDLVRARLDMEDDQKVQEEFGDLFDQLTHTDETSEDEAAAEDQQEESKPGSWRTQAGLIRNDKGKYDDTLDNLTKIITHDPLLQAIRYNELTGAIDVDPAVKLPWEQAKPGWADADLAQLKLYIERMFQLYSTAKTNEALQIATSTRRFHPIRQYLAALPEWDKQERLDRLLIDYLGAENTEYVKAVTRKTFTAAVARVMRPGCKFDQVLILAGPQGTGKSTLFAKLAGDWFSDALSLNDMRDKTGSEKLQGYWILELGELAGMRKMEVETVKGFLSRTDDKYRAAYARTVESHPRQCVIVGSTNAENGFLRDVTGNRRFWPVNITGESKSKSWDLDQDTVDQLWAEALFRYNAGEPLHLTGAVAADARAQQDAAIETDERVGMVEEYLDVGLPADWWSWTTRQRRAFLTSSDGDFADLEHVGAETRPRMSVSNAEIWAECFGRDPGDMKPADSYMISAIMQKLEGWEKTKSSKRVFPYGKQRIYARVEPNQPPF